MSNRFNIINQNQFSFSDLTSNLKLVDPIEIGYQPNKTNSGAHSIAIGSQTGIINQGTFGIAIGYQAAQYNQGLNAIAIGKETGQNNQGTNSIAIGTQAGQTNQPSNSIIINASGNSLNSNTSGLFIKPIRNVDNLEFLEYNDNTSEVTRREFKINTAGDYTYALFNSDYGKWLLCDGRVLNVNDYPNLFAVMGYSFGGAGNLFNLPDARGRVLGAIGQGSGLSNRTLGQIIGEETHTLNVNEMPTHSHSINDPGHTHTYNNSNDNFLMTGGLNFINLYAKGDIITQSTTTATTGITTNNTGGGQPHDIMNPTLFIGNLFVYTD